MSCAKRPLDEGTQQRGLVARCGDSVTAPRRVTEDEDRLCGGAADRVARRTPQRRVAPPHARRGIEGSPACYGPCTGRWSVEKKRYQQCDGSCAKNRGRQHRPAFAQLTPSVLDVRDDESREERNEPG